MKKIFHLFIVLLFCPSLYGQNSIVIDNNTGQRIASLKYWIGPESQSENPNIQFRERPALDSGQQDYTIPVSFHRKKRNCIIVRAYLAGGGYTKAKYSIEEGETRAEIPLFNPANRVPGDNFKSVIDKFREFNFDREYLKITSTNGLKSTLGGLIVVDESEKTILYTITPKELKSELPNICTHANRDFATGTFSSSTAVSGNLSLPFVSVNTAFSSGDVAKFKWTIENVGECRWAPIGDKDLATLFSELSQRTKSTLIQIYKDNPNAKMKFINNAFVIGRIEIETIKSKSVDYNSELTGSSFVTAKGNYGFVEDYRTENVVNDIITRVDGHYVTSLLANLYLLDLAESKMKLTDEQNDRLKSEFNYLLKLYADDLTPTDDTEIMKKQIVDLNKKKNGEISFLKTEGEAPIKLLDVVKTNDTIGEVKRNEDGGQK